MPILLSLAIVITAGALTWRRSDHALAAMGTAIGAGASTAATGDLTARNKEGASTCPAAVWAGEAPKIIGPQSKSTPSQRQLKLGGDVSATSQDSTPAGTAGPTRPTSAAGATSSTSTTSTSGATTGSGAAWRHQPRRRHLPHLPRRPHRRHRRHRRS